MPDTRDEEPFVDLFDVFGRAEEPPADGGRVGANFGAACMPIDYYNKCIKSETDDEY